MYFENMNKSECNGCTACMNICPKKAITMEKDEEGFLYPKINEEKCVKCGICKNICTLIHNKKQQNILKGVYGVKIKDESKRATSRSGGIFRSISDDIINDKGTVYGAAFDENLNVIHKKINNIEDLDLLSGSKYVQSDLKETFNEVEKDLKNNLKVLYSGTACQIAGLKAYLDTKKVDTKNLYTCDVVCHGVPSPKLYKDYLKFIEKKYKNKIVKFNFRDKKFGWAAHRETIVLNNNKEFSSNYYTSLFYSNNALRPSCYECQFANLNRISDITIADFWGIDNINKNFNDNRGVSLVLVNNEKGQELFEQTKYKLNYIECEINQCMQPNLRKPTEKPNCRQNFWDDYEKKGFNYILKQYTNYGLKNKTKNIYNKIINKIKK